jgi:hypothetical protein
MTQCGSGGGFHTYIAFIYLIDQSLLISFIHLFKSIKREGFVQTVPRCGGGGGGGGCHIQWWWNRRRPALTVAVATSGVESGRVESGGDLESFGMKSETTRGHRDRRGLLIGRIL